MLVTNKQKVTEKSTPPSKNNDWICIEPRDQKKARKTTYYPMVIVDEVTNRLSGSKSFNSLDAFRRYWQLPVEDESWKLLKYP